MNRYSKNVFPWLTEFFLDNRRLNAERRTTLSDARGRVLEVGLGSGLNLPWYPKDVELLVGLDPSEQAIDLAQKRICVANFPVKLKRGTCETAELPVHSFDYIVTTWTLCMIQEPVSALKRMREFLKPGGRFLFLEHGRSSTHITAQLQDIWNPIHRRLCAGCNVNRRIDDLVRTAGFEILSLDRFDMFSLGLFLSAYRGVAAP